MLKMFAIVHAQSHSGTKGKMVRDENGNVKGYQKGNQINNTKKWQKANATTSRGGIYEGANKLLRG